MNEGFNGLNLKKINRIENQKSCFVADPQYGDPAEPPERIRIRDHGAFG